MIWSYQKFVRLCCMLWLAFPVNNTQYQSRSHFKRAWTTKNGTVVEENIFISFNYCFQLCVLFISFTLLGWKGICDLSPSQIREMVCFTEHSSNEKRGRWATRSLSMHYTRIRLLRLRMRDSSVPFRSLWCLSLDHGGLVITFQTKRNEIK